MKKNYPDEILKIAKAIAELSKIYWHHDCFPKEFKRAKRDWRSALIQFTADYAYERQGAPLAYRAIAEKALKHITDKQTTPNAALPEAAWKEFQRRAHDFSIRPNYKVNPLRWMKNSKNISSVEFVLKLKDDRYNILRWSARMARKGEAKAATKELRSICGIGPKLAAFYLRDVARFDGIDEDPPKCFQPVDSWIRRIAGQWAKHLKRSVSNDKEVVSLFIGIAKGAEVRAGDLNAEAWVLGSQLLVQILDCDLKQVVCNWSDFTDCITANYKWNKAANDILRAIKA